MSGSYLKKTAFLLLFCLIFFIVNPVLISAEEGSSTEDKCFQAYLRCLNDLGWSPPGIMYCDFGYFFCLKYIKN